MDQVASLAGKTVTGGRLNLNKMFDGGSSPTPPPTGDVTGARVTTANFAGSTSNNFNRVRLTFNEAISSTSFDTNDVSLTGPNATPVTIDSVAPVPGTTNQFDVFFAPQSAIGTYAITVGPQVLDLASTPNPMDQNQNGANGEATADRYTGTAKLYPPREQFTYSGLPVPIKDKSTTNFNFTIPATSAMNGFTITDVNFTLSLTHTYVSDLTISLIAPNGKSVTLFNRRGGSGDNLTNTTFNDEAGTAIANGSAPFSGSFRPDALLSGFDGLNPVGTWTLRVQDSRRGGVGQITGFTLDVATNPGDSGNGMMGVADQPATDSPVAVGPGVADSFGTDTPTLIAPSTSNTPVRSAPVAPPASADVTVAGSTPTVAPQFADGLSALESTAFDVFDRTARQTFTGFTIE